MLEEHIVRLREQLDREREERNYFQLERDKIHTFWEITDSKLEEFMAEKKNFDKDTEEDEGRHQVEIKVFKQKMKHLLCEHQNTVSELKAHGLVSKQLEQEKHEQLQTELHKEMRAIVVNMQELNNENLVKELEVKHKEEMTKIVTRGEKQYAETEAEHDKKLELLQQQLDNFRLNFTSETEDQWNSYINTLIEDHNKAVIEVEVALPRIQQAVEENRSLKKSIDEMMKTQADDGHLVSVLLENQHLVQVLSEVEEESTKLERLLRFSSLAKVDSEKIKKKKLGELKRDIEALEQKFCKLQIETNELYETSAQNMQEVQQKADLKSVHLEGKLKDLTDGLQETRARLLSVISASNIDQTALDGVTNTIEENQPEGNDGTQLCHEMKMAEKGPAMATLTFTGIIVCAFLLGQGSAYKIGKDKEDQKDAILREIISKWSTASGWNSQKSPPEPHEDQSVIPWVRNIVGSLKSLGVLPGKNLLSLNKPIDRRRLSGFLYNISLYLQEMGAELEEAPADAEDQLWEKVLHYVLQSEESAAGNQWNGRIPPRPSVRLQDWFVSLRGSPHWDWFLGLLQSLISLSERQSHRPLLTFLSENWRTVSAVFEAALQALLSGTYGQASAGLQGFICALKGQGDCAFSVSWLQQLLRFLETRSWKPVVSLHPAGEGAEHSRSASVFGRLRPFSLPPEAMSHDELSGNASQREAMTAEDGPDSMQSFLMQALSRSGGGERGGHLAQKNVALLQGLDGLRRGFLHRVGSSVYGNLRKKVSRVTMALLDDVSSLVDVPEPNARGRCSVGDLRQLILWGIRHNVSWNTQALGSEGFPTSLPFLTCPPTETDKLRLLITPDKSSPEERPSSRTTSEKTNLHDLPTKPLPPQLNLSQAEYLTSIEILEAACNESIPGLTGVSNFTVFLYCKLFEGENGSVDPAQAQMGLDLHATCSDAAWYLSAAEDDFLWVHVCSEFFAHEFNNTVCANSSFWLHRAQQAASTRDYHLFNMTSIDDLCVQLTGEAIEGPVLDDNCAVQLGQRFLSAEAFRHCFLPNTSILVSAVCGGQSANPLHTSAEGSWASTYCSKIHNFSRVDTVRDETCQYRAWAVHDFTNFTLLELCEQTRGLREYMCHNASLFNRLTRAMPQFADFCADLQAELEGRKCLLQRFFDMLPAPYDFDTSQLCVDPAPMLVEVLHKLSVCEVEGGEREGFLVALGYVLRVLDFMVGLSSGLDEGEREARQGLGQAILLSSVLDHTSWATLQPEASMSVLHTVGVFLRREQNATLKEDLLSCFSPVLWDLIQLEDNSSALRFLLQEYLQMPRDSIRTLVMSAEKDAVKRFLSHMHHSWDKLQVETGQASQKELQAMETMTAAFIHKFPRVTPELFVDLSQFIPYMSVSDIMSFPASLIVNDSVLTAIRDHSSEMKSLQKKAFVKRLLQSSVVGDVATWPPYFLSSILPLLPYLPVTHFQQLTSQQLTPLVELLGNGSLDGVRGRHVVRTLYSRQQNLTRDNILRLGVLACYLDPVQLGSFLQDSAVSSALWQQLAQCMSNGLISTSGRLASWLIPAVETLNVSSMTPHELFALSGLFPQLGASFLLSIPSQLLVEILSQPGSQRHPPAQAFQMLAKISKDTSLTVETLCRLKSLLSGLSSAALKHLHWSEISEAEHCQCWKLLLTELRPAHRAMIYNAMHETLQNITQWDHCLLPFIPLRKLTEILDGKTVLRNVRLYRDIRWSTQQAQVLFKRIHQVKNITSKMVSDLGHVSGGMSCDFLRLFSNKTDFVELLQFVSEQPGGMRPALRKCIIEELRQQPEINLSALSPGFAATLPVTMIEELSNASFRAVLDHLQAHFADFLRMPHYKQTNLAEKAVTELGSYRAEWEIDGTTLDVLGPLLPFLDRDSLALVDRGALAVRLEEMKSFCLPKEALNDISALFTQKDLLGEPSQWQAGDVEHLGRLVFSLSTKQINSIPLSVLNRDTVEQVLVGQSCWEDSVVGGVCVTQCTDHRRQRRTTRSLLRGIVKARSRRAKVPVPSCADIRGTFPSAWTSTQLSRMSQEDLKECVEVLAQDASMSSEQRRALWLKLRKSFSPVRELRADQVLALGPVVTEMGERDLQDASLTDPGVLAHLGTLTDWSPKKTRAVILGVMRKRKLKVEQLTAVDLATFGNLMCGFYPSEIKRLSPYSLSVAVLFLRETSLPCTEQQMEELTSRLSRPEAFGPVSAWGPEVFTEIGTLAAGLEDLVLSALVQEQVEGISPEAIALMGPKKMAVVFGAVQMSWLSAEQAWAVTQEQWALLDAEQRHAVGLARYEGDVLLELRGRNSATAAHSFASYSLALCLLLMQLI
ncbi:stereocilin isoform 3-T3 [Spinachia spinachia]